MVSLSLRVFVDWHRLAAVSIVLAVIPSTGNCAEPIDVGSRKQLFVDEKFIEDQENVQLVMNPPWRTGDVLIKADQPHEAGGSIGGYSTIIKEDDGRIRVWYDLRTPTGAKTAGRPKYERQVCYAESTDGLHFDKPKLGLYEVGGSTANNVVLPADIGGCSVWIDPQAPPEHRYKTQAKVYESKAYPTRGFRMHSSPDGINWTHFPNVDPGGSIDTQTIIFWDRRLDCYLLYSRHNEPGDVRLRKVRRAEMKKLTEIRNTGLVFWPDEQDQSTYKSPPDVTPVDYYGATVFPYKEAEGVYIMLAQAFWHWMPREQSTGKVPGPGTRDVRLAVSRDSEHFKRVGKRKAFLRMGPAGRFDSHAVWAMPNPIVMGDEIWIYYVGTNEDRSRLGRNEQTLSAISRAVMRLDGFVSVDAPYEGGQFTTPPLRFTGDRLELNLDTSAGGGVRVEMLDADGSPIPGLSGDASDWLVGNSVRLTVTWKGATDLKRWEGRSVRLRFLMRDCKLYAFRFRPS